MTNDEYSQLAAKAAGVTIGSNGRPAFTSYEQSMKYAEALTNLHKSGINKNSTPQEIAAASVGTTVNKNGTPNISSVSQGQSYGSALKNLKSNPQPNVNQNSNETKPNNTGSQNNTSNNANANTTGSTKPSSSANTSRSANSTNSTSSSNKFTNEEYSQLAAQVTGVAIDPKGRPVFSSYEESMRYAEALTNLHKSGINKNSTPQEIAAASVGTTVNKNGTPNISNVPQGQNYGKALGNLLKGTQQGVSYVEPDSSRAKANSSDNVNQMTNSNSSSNVDRNKAKHAVAVLAAQNTKLKIDSNGKLISNNPVDKRRFWDEYKRLMQNGDKIMAAAAAGISVDRNGNPIWRNKYEKMNYDRAHEVLFGNGGYTQKNNLITKKQLQSVSYTDDGYNINWDNMTDDEIKELNNVLQKYNINTPERISQFIAQCSIESHCGDWLMELGSDEYLNNMDYYPYYGAGYIQLTWEYNYSDFAEAMGDKKILTEGPQYVAENYAWEAAGWFWDKNNLNDMVDNGASTYDITKVVRGSYGTWEMREEAYEKTKEALNN